MPDQYLYRNINLDSSLSAFERWTNYCIDLNYGDTDVVSLKHTTEEAVYNHNTNMASTVKTQYSQVKHFLNSWL